MTDYSTKRADRATLLKLIGKIAKKKDGIFPSLWNRRLFGAQALDRILVCRHMRRYKSRKHRQNDADTEHHKRLPPGKRRKVLYAEQLCNDRVYRQNQYIRYRNAQHARQTTDNARFRNEYARHVEFPCADTS